MVGGNPLIRRSAMATLLTRLGRLPCSRRPADDTRKTMHLTTTPAEATVAGAAVSADVMCLPDRSWNVVVVLRRSPAPDLIDASEVDAEILDAGGGAVSPLTRPRGPL